jgi:hypothetical protein
MSQVLTPEEMAALFEGLKEAEDGPPGSSYCHVPKETTSRSRFVPERDPIFSFPTISNWMMILADLRWPNL